MRKALFFLTLLFLVLQSSAQEFSVKKGIVVDSLKVTDSLQETFALYLPTSFDTTKAWPVLFIFDDKGRGRTAAQLLLGAAEEQGYILVSSNDLKEENEFLENVEVAARLVSAVSAMLPVDYHQVSAIGSLEGAKVATSIPVIFEDIHGVIAVGNHWINFELIDPKKDFIFIGIVGDEQYTLSSMKFTANALSSFRFPTEVYTYDGNEHWPNTQILNSAVGSLTLSAMKKELRPKDPELINKLYQEDLLRVNKMISLQNLMKANSFLDLMESKYSSLREISAVRERQDQLQRSRNFIEQRREQEKIEEKERRLIDDFIYYLAEDIRTANFENLGWWSYQKKQLDSLSQVGGPEAKLANRLKSFISELATIKRKELEKSRNLESKLLANMVQTIFDPTNFEAYKNIISLSAQDNDFGTALFYLEEMLKHGFKNKEELYNIENTLGLRLTPEYNKIIERHLGSAKFHDN